MTANGSPYVGLRPFKESESGKFFGRKRETETLLNRIYASRTVVVFAASGVGKTSLLRAGVMNELRLDKDLCTIYINDWTKPCLSQVREALSKAHPDGTKPVPLNSSSLDSASATEPSLMQLLRGFRTATKLKPVLILDQFEEVLRYQTNRAQIWDQLAPLMNALQQPARIVLSLREDYLGILDELMNRVPGLLENRYRVLPLSMEAIRDAIVSPLERLPTPFTIEPNLISRIIQDFELKRQDASTEGRIEAGYLQLVCQRLWELDKDNPAFVLREVSYTKEGGIDAIVESHIQRVLSKALTQEQQFLLYAMIRYLVTPTGAKVALGTKDLGELLRREDFSEQGKRLLPAYASATGDHGVLQHEEGEKNIEAIAECLCGPEMLILRRKEFRKRVSYELCHDLLGTVLLRWRTSVLEREAIQATREKEKAERNFLNRTQSWLGAAVVLTLSLAGHAFLIYVIVEYPTNWLTSSLGYWVATSLSVSATFLALKQRRAIGRFLLGFVTPLRKRLPTTRGFRRFGHTLSYLAAFVVLLPALANAWENFLNPHELGDLGSKLLEFLHGLDEVLPWWLILPSYLAVLISWVYSLFRATGIAFRADKVFTRLLAAAFVVLSIGCIFTSPRTWPVSCRILTVWIGALWGAHGLSRRVTGRFLGYEARPPIQRIP